MNHLPAYKRFLCLPPMRFSRTAFVLLGTLLAVFFAASGFAQDKPDADRGRPKPKAAVEQNLPSAGAEGRAKQERRGPQREDSEDIRRREEWFYSQRAYPLKQIPPGARLEGLRQLDQMLEREGMLLRQPSGAAEQLIPPSTTMWTPIGPQPTVGTFFGNTSGRVTALAVDPTDPSIVYLGGAQGGVWKTTNGGTTWTQLTDSQPSLAVGSIAIDPSSCVPAPCKTIYVGTGEENFAGDSYYGAGILKSINGGAAWQQLGASVFVGPFSGGFSPGGGARIGSLAINPTNSQMLLAGVQIISNSNTSGIYCSDDGGVNWRNVLPGAPGTAVVFDPAGTIAYAALGRVRPGNSLNGVYKSTNVNLPCSAQVWNTANGTGTNVLPSGNAVGRIELAIAPSAPSTLYASIQDPRASTFGALLGFFKSSDAGASWIRLTGYAGLLRAAMLVRQRRPRPPQ